MTKTIIIGQPAENQNKKPIKLLCYLGYDKMFSTSVSTIQEYCYLELICKNYRTGNDLIFAYKDSEKRNDGMLYLGQWNDGVVE